MGNAILVFEGRVNFDLYIYSKFGVDDSCWLSKEVVRWKFSLFLDVVYWDLGLGFNLIICIGIWGKVVFFWFVFDLWDWYDNICF